MRLLLALVFNDAPLLHYRLDTSLSLTSSPEGAEQLQRHCVMFALQQSTACVCVLHTEQHVLGLKTVGKDFF